MDQVEIAYAEKLIQESKLEQARFNNAQLIKALEERDETIILLEDTIGNLRRELDQLKAAIQGHHSRLVE